MIPTPSLSHLSRDDFLNVYEPAEDTFILLDALEQDAAELQGTDGRHRHRPRLVVEIGSGSGCVSAFIATILGDQQAAYICTDINPKAANCTDRTGAANKASLQPVLTSTVTALAPRLQTGLVDLLLFNPPYVPTTPEEEEQAQRDAAISGSWAGGSTGTRLLDELLDDVAGLGKGGVETLLAPGGRFYFIAIKQNDPDALVSRLEAKGLPAKVVLSRRAGREHLFVIRAQRPPGPGGP
ncbi:unnamed protein product [Parajaminaea phylloscopi]